jgi:hypothetical protein
LFHAPVNCRNQWEQTAVSEFTDVNGKKYSVVLDGPLVEKVHKALGLDISAEDGTGLIRCCQSGVLIVRACYILCEEQLGGMSPEAFGKAMASGDVVEKAEKALREAVVFFTRPSRRETLTSVLQAQDQVTLKTMEAIRTQVANQETQDMILDATKAKMTDVIGEIVKKLQARPSGLSANDSPDTSAVVPVGSP